MPFWRGTRRKATASVAAICVLLGLVAGVASSDAGRSRARLTLLKSAPVTVRGSAFHAHESVRLVLRRRVAAPAVSHVTAGAGGGFTAAFIGVKVSRCGGFSVVAVGARGSRATVRRALPLPACSRAGLDEASP